MLSTLAPAAAAAPPFEPYAALQTQVKGRQVLKATIHPKLHVARVTLRDGKKFRARIPKGQQRALVASMRAAGAKVHVKKKHKSWLRYRYIALALVVIGALVGAVYLVRRRRRRRAAD
jgi:ATP-dependent Zn protease